MCNLSVGVFERGWNNAWDQAWNESQTDTKKKMVVALLKKNMDMQFIVDVTGLKATTVSEIAKEAHMTMKE